MEVLAKEVDFTLCPKIEAAFSILGRKWNGLIIHTLLHKENVRFSELAQIVNNLSDRMLSARLKELEENGIVEKKASCQMRGVSVYQLTQKGVALASSLTELEHWAEEYC
ncbi:transcriptional regulator, HxlR family [Pilibacter termitis]|uniref:Transcriptional regulator, HxlR family n=1 Tax=Pilibacter termitis TaxID=263852 RepID=A0A1T4M627_9ENTE|nr:helix-turn-helix domain-containing protein [Pilibacter termitis]SJZ62365.1 transcriptional regulator, HxlR family [Pilibacter termitis]